MLIFRFIYWKIKDLINNFKNRKDKKIHLYGIYGFFGLPGYGKTMDIQRELIILNESEFIPRRYEKTLKHLEKQNNIIKSIYDKINK